jgi:Ca2+-binding EF-hand superfamily protein
MTATSDAVKQGFVPVTDAAIERAFNDFDTNKDRSLSISELRQALLKLKLRASESDLRALVRKIDTDSSDAISFEEFRSFYRQRESTLYAAFTVLNSGGQPNSGLTAASLRSGLSVMKLRASDEDIRKFIQVLDRNNDGRVSFEEFRDCMLLLPPTNARAVFDTCRDMVHIQHSNGEYTPPLDLAQVQPPSELRGFLGMLLAPVSAQLIG